MSEQVKTKKEFMELTPEELAKIDQESKNVLKSSYMIDFTKKKWINQKALEKLMLSLMEID